jgi:hypothetical protein
MDLQFSETTLPTLALWGLGLGAIIIGFLVGYIDSNLRSAKLIEGAESKAEVIRSEAERRIAEAQALKEQIPAMVDDPGLLRLKIKNGIAHLEIDGVLLNTKNISADQKKRLIELLSVIRPWLEGGQPATTPPMPTQTTPALQPVPQPVSSSERAPFRTAASPVPSTTAAQTLPVTNLSEKEFKALSIIAQIDHVFQTRIIGTPYEAMGIRIFEGSIGSVEVKIGASKYPSIDDVPDAEIKKAIRAAIAEWEQKYTPGQ